MTTDRRRLEVMAVPWGELSRTTRQGYREIMHRGAVRPDELIGLPVIDDHTGSAVGVVEDARDTDAGLTAVLRMTPTVRSAELYELAADGALGASLGFDTEGHRAAVSRDGVVNRSRVNARELSLTPLPAYQGSRVLMVRKAADMSEMAPETTGGEPATYEFTDAQSVQVTAASAPETRSAPADTADTAPAQTRSAPHVEYASAQALERLASRVDSMRSAPAAGGGNGPLSRFPSFGHYAAAAYRGDVTPQETRALADQITGNNPGVMPPNWVNDVRGIVSRPRRMVEGTGGAMSAGESGMDLNWPYFDGDLNALVAVQAAQKTQVNSVRVDIKRGSEALETYAGGSDIAFQLIERSSPAYLDAYLRIMAAAYGVITERAFAQALYATDGTPAPVTLAEFYEFVIFGSGAVEDATGSAPSVIGLASDVWVEVAGATDADGRPIYPPLNPSNAPGAPVGPGATGGITVAGIPTFRIPGLAAGGIVITNGEAARWAEDGPRTISADDVALLGRDVAVYGYATPAVFVPAGVVVGSTAGP